MSDFPGYGEFFESLKSEVRATQVRAVLSVNRELVLLYWRLGRQILECQEKEGWGSGVVERLAVDLRAAFPEVKGFSRRNLHYMQAFARAFPELEFVQQAAAQIPWGHTLVLLDRVKDEEARLFYLVQTRQHGWSRNLLLHQIDSRLHERQGKALSNFRDVLTLPYSDLAQQTFKDPYLFDFLMLAPEARERDLERGLLAHVRDFLVELGVGFSFVGSQVPLQVGDQDFRIDMLFYHLKLRCFVVVELKLGEFKPEFAGKLNFYLSAVDDLMREPHDQPSIGLILCKDRNQLIVEYALRDLNKPIGVSEYQLVQALPEELRGSLPTVEELESELNGHEV